MARKNRLHEFASYNTLFTLSGISQKQIDDKTFLTDSLLNIIARSGGIGKGDELPGGEISTFEVSSSNPLTKSIQEKYGQNQLREQRNNPDYNEGIEILDRAHDIFFENVNILSVPSPNNERNLADFSKMEFELVEPYGITFIEKIRAVAFRMGFKDYMDAPFLLTIDFVGYDNQGRKIHNIGQNKKRLQRKIPIFITNVEFEVDAGGAKYNVIAVPYADRVHSDEIKFPRTQAQLEVSSISEYIRKIENQLNNVMMAAESSQGHRGTKEYWDKYIFEVDRELFNIIGDRLPANPDKTINRTESIADSIANRKENLAGLSTAQQIVKALKNGNIQFATGIGATGSASDPIYVFVNGPLAGQRKRQSAITLEMLKFPEQKLNAADGVNQAEQTQKNTGTETITTEMGISIVEGTSIVKNFEDVIRNTPFLLNLTNNFWISFVQLATGQGPAGERISEGDAIRIINQPDQQARLSRLIDQNPYVPWFKIKTNISQDTSKIDPITKMHPKTFKFTAIPHRIPVHKFLKPGQTVPTKTLEDQVEKKYRYIYTGENVDVQNLRIFYQTAFYQRNITGDPKQKVEPGLVAKDSQAVKISVVGQEATEKNILGVRAYPSTRKGKSSADLESPLTAKSQEFMDYLTNPQADMLKIELEILGDPAYICQDMYTPTGDRLGTHLGGSPRSLPFNETYESFNADSFMPIIFLEYRLPTDLNQIKGAMFFDKKAKEQQSFFTGTYHVARIESSISENAFTQVLTCNRLLNQDGEGKPFLQRVYSGAPDIPYGDDNPPSVL